MMYPGILRKQKNLLIRWYKGVKASKYVDGATSNIRRYKYLGKYIDMDKVNKIIVSFGFIT